jgi:hypothetical protein
VSEDDGREGQDGDCSNVDIDAVTGKTVEVTETKESDDGFPSPDELIGNFMSETSLWPVLIVLIGSGGAMGAAMLILTVVDRNPFAAGAILLVFGMSVDVFIQARRKAIYRNIAKLIGLLWCATIGLAGVAVWTGIAF